MLLWNLWATFKWTQLTLTWKWMAVEKCTSSLATNCSGRPCACLVSIWSEIILVFNITWPVINGPMSLSPGGIHNWKSFSVSMQMHCQFGSCHLSWLTGMVRGFSGLRTRKASRHLFLLWLSIIDLLQLKLYFITGMHNSHLLAWNNYWYPVCYLARLKGLR